MSVWLIPDNELVFPHPLIADETGIIGIGGDLQVERLKLAYRFGIFPWYGPDEPLMWWFPDPRCILFPSNIIIRKSMRPYINQGKFEVTVDRVFGEVIGQCQQARRPGQDGTWIDNQIRVAYTALHKAGYAHSVEIWEGGRLVGGLYGVAMGKIFYGESMFSLKANASKFALIYLCRMLQHMDFRLIDCQQDTPHLRKMGAELMSAMDFYRELKANLFEKDLCGNWADIDVGEY